jgi:hypothetical protein
MVTQLWQRSVAVAPRELTTLREKRIAPVDLKSLMNFFWLDYGMALALTTCGWAPWLYLIIWARDVINYAHGIPPAHRSEFLVYFYLIVEQSREWFSHDD